MNFGIRICITHVQQMVAKHGIKNCFYRFTTVEKAQLLLKLIAMEQRIDSLKIKP